MTAEIKPWCYVESAWGLALIIDYHDEKRLEYLPKPKSPLKSLFTSTKFINGEDFFILPVNTSRVPTNFAWQPYVWATKFSIKRIYAEGERIPVPQGYELWKLDGVSTTTLDSICPSCNVLLEWHALAQKCPKCWKVF